MTRWEHRQVTSRHAGRGTQLVKDGKVVLTFDLPTDEAHLNWRQQSRVSEVWLLKN